MEKLDEKIGQLFEKNHFKITLEDLITQFHLEKKEIEDLKVLLNQLQQEGKIYLTDSNEYIPFPQNEDLGIGKVYIKNKKRTFVRIGENSLFIPEDQLNGALKGDIVIVRKNHFSHLGENSGTVEKILNRQDRFLIFECYKEDGKKKIRPYNIPFKFPISLNKNDWKSISVGDRFAVHIDIVNHNGIFHGDILFRVGNKIEPHFEMKTIAACHGIRISFSKEIEEEALKIPNRVSEEEIQQQIRLGRKDLRSKTIFTIDGKNTKDLDDAISLEINEKGNYVLGVHIADVAHYVKEGSEIQKEAAKRGTSYYFGSLVIPMIHPKLSNGICSLNPNVDRLARTKEIELTSSGEVIHCQTYKSIIRSRKKMTYEEVNQILDQKREIPSYSEFTPILKKLLQLSNQLEQKKDQRGYINFGREDFYITTDKNGRANAVIPIHRGSAEKLIENFMLLDNELTAIEQENFQFLKDFPFIYRTHDFPNKDRIHSVINYLIRSGFSIQQQDYQNPKDFQLLLKSLASLPSFPAIADILIQGFCKAKYSTNNIGHYGLALFHYTHSTSPIRRYSDLQTQYNMDQFLNEDTSTIDIEERNKQMLQICAHNTEVEKIASVTDNEITQYQFAQYMEDKVGKEFIGMITYIGKHHVLIRTSDYIPGSIETEALLALGYELEQSTVFVDLNSKKRLRIGDFIRVILEEVDLEKRKIKFSLPKEKNKIYVKTEITKKGQ